MKQITDTKNTSVQENVPQENRYRVPVVDICERENEFLIEADMPGTKEENIQVEFHQGELTIRGKVDRPTEEREKSLYRFHQFDPLDYYRVFRIGESVNTAKISASCGDGVVTIHLPKAEKLKPKKIEVVKKA